CPRPRVGFSACRYPRVYLRTARCVIDRRYRMYINTPPVDQFRPGASLALVRRNVKEALMANDRSELSRRSLLGFMGATTAATAIGAGMAIAAPAAAQERRAARLFFTDTGNGPDVMLIHGWTCDSHDWSWQLPVFESKYRVIAPD